jgi:hypothetical protein
MSAKQFINPDYDLGQHRALRTFFWRVFLVFLLLFLCL